jgi:hypothetical protein
MLRGPCAASKAGAGRLGGTSAPVSASPPCPASKMQPCPRLRPWAGLAHRSVIMLLGSFLPVRGIDLPGQGRMAERPVRVGGSERGPPTRRSHGLGHGLSPHLGFAALSRPAAMSAAHTRRHGLAGAAWALATRSLPVRQVDSAAGRCCPSRRACGPRDDPSQCRRSSQARLLCRPPPGCPARLRPGYGRPGSAVGMWPGSRRRRIDAAAGSRRRCGARRSSASGRRAERRVPEEASRQVKRREGPKQSLSVCCRPVKLSQ